jgi:ABC-type dipeptide/oligopeptide/nickel transport system permease subunit
MRWLAVALGCFGVLSLAALLAPEYVSVPDLKSRYLGPFEAPPFGTDERGIPLVEYAMQGTSIVLMPSIVAGILVMMFATFAGLVRCAGVTWLDSVLQLLTEFVGALPRLVVVLVVAVLIPPQWKGLLPIAVLWALLSAPGAMDEAAASAGRLGGARFVEALRAHGFSSVRIYLYHVVWLNLRPVLARQGAEVTMQVVFLEIALSYLAVSRNEPAFTHAESEYSWAVLLYQGYSWLAFDQNLGHAMALGVALLVCIAGMAQAFRLAARAR